MISRKRVLQWKAQAEIANGKSRIEEVSPAMRRGTAHPSNAAGMARFRLSFSSLHPSTPLLMNSA